MAKAKWKYRDEGDDQFGICFGGRDPRFLWMGVRGSFQIAFARLICRELNRAGVEVEPNPDKGFLLEVVTRKSAKKKAEAAR